MASLYLALERGYFDQEGLEVSVNSVLASPQALPLLAAGGLDASFTAMSPALINAAARGARIRIVGGREYFSPTCGDFGAVYARREDFPNGLNDISQLRGKRIAVRRAGGLGEMALGMVLQSAGMTVDDVQVEYMMLPEAIAALSSGAVDAAVSQSDIEKAPAAAERLVSTPALGAITPGFQYSYVIFGRRLLDADPKIGAHLLHAYLRATREFLAGSTPQFLHDYAESNGLVYEAVRDACRNTIAEDGEVDRASIERYVAWAVSRGYCPEAPSYDQVVDTRFLELSRQL